MKKLSRVTPRLSVPTVRPSTRTLMMTSSVQSLAQRNIPILLLKTRSQPVDTYDEILSNIDPSGENTTPFSFNPQFIPVLEHAQNEGALSRLVDLLRSGDLKRRYGGMIFTSQRAVEVWADVVHKVEATPEDPSSHGESNHNTSTVGGDNDDAFADLETLTPFPMYVVGPATERALKELAISSQARSPSNANTNNGSNSSSKRTSSYIRLNTSIHGAHSGNGANLADFILSHYNQLHHEHYFTYFEAPRLPFIPLLGMSSQNYGRKRLEKDDPRLMKKPLLFLVGEVRRDIIPKTLMGRQGKDAERRIEVIEEEVYRTGVMEGFEGEFGDVCEMLAARQNGAGDEGAGIAVVVVFSPQGSNVMLKSIGYLNEQQEVTEQAKNRWWEEHKTAEKHQRQNGVKWIVATIGPTTRDYLKNELGVEPDVCAAKPSPEGLKKAIEEFLIEKKIRV